MTKLTNSTETSKVRRPYATRLTVEQIDLISRLARSKVKCVEVHRRYFKAMTYQAVYKHYKKALKRGSTGDGLRNRSIELANLSEKQLAGTRPLSYLKSNTQ